MKDRKIIFSHLLISFLKSTVGSACFSKAAGLAIYSEVCEIFLE